MMLKFVITSVMSHWMVTGVFGSADDHNSKIHLGVSPENVEHFILLLHQDRQVLKSILANALLFYENGVMDMILEAYNATLQAGLCSVKQCRIKRKVIQDQRQKLEAEVDTKIDNIVEEWTNRQTQEGLGTNWDAFWKGRNELYSYVTNRNDFCIHEATCGTGWGKMELAYFFSFQALSYCKRDFWPTKIGPLKLPK